LSEFEELVEAELIGELHLNGFAKPIAAPSALPRSDSSEDSMPRNVKKLAINFPT